MENRNDNFFYFKTKFHKIDGQGADQLKRFFRFIFQLAVNLRLDGY